MDLLRNKTEKITQNELIIEEVESHTVSIASKQNFILKLLVVELFLPPDFLGY